MDMKRATQELPIDPNPGGMLGESGGETIGQQYSTTFAIAAFLAADLWLLLYAICMDVR
jgi:hypothetical protein